MLDIGQKLDYSARMLLPGMLTLFAMLLVMLPFGMHGVGQFPPSVCLLSIYYWSIFRPSTMPFWFVFLLGIIQDALFGTPLGVSSLLFILFRLMVLSQQRMLVKESFWAAWLGCGLVVAIAGIAHWLLASANANHFLPFTPVVMQWVFTFGLYPLAHVLFNALYRHVPAPAGSSAKHSKRLL